MGGPAGRIPVVDPGPPLPEEGQELPVVPLGRGEVPAAEQGVAHGVEQVRIVPARGFSEVPNPVQGEEAFDGCGEVPFLVLDDSQAERDRGLFPVALFGGFEELESLGPYCLQGTTEPGRAVDFAIHTEPAVRRLLEAAFQRAATKGQGLTLAHKANVLKHGHGLWLRVFEAVRAGHPQVSARTLHADALLCALVQNPRAFGIIAADNYLGDLISDLTAAYNGGMGVAPSLSWAPHKPFRCQALAEPVHGSAPDIAGQGVANPAGMFLSTALLFRHLGWEAEALALEDAVTAALQAGAATRDLGGTLTTKAMGEAIGSRLP